MWWAWFPGTLNPLGTGARNISSVCLCMLEGRGMNGKQVVPWAGWSARDAAASPLEKGVQGMAGMWSLCRDLQVPLPPLPWVCSPEQVTYLFFPASFPASCGLDAAGSRRSSAEAQLCNSAGIKSLCWTSTPFSAPVGWGRKEITQTFLFTPLIFLWVLYRISPGCTRWAIEGNHWQCFGLAGGFLTFKITSLQQFFSSYLLGWDWTAVKPVLQHQMLFIPAQVFSWLLHLLSICLSVSKKVHLVPWDVCTKKKKKERWHVPRKSCVNFRGMFKVSVFPPFHYC